MRVLEGSGADTDTKRDLASPKCFVLSGVETGKIFFSFVCLKERMGSERNTQPTQ